MFEDDSWSLNILLIFFYIILTIFVVQLLTHMSLHCEDKSLLILILGLYLIGLVLLVKLMSFGAILFVLFLLVIWTLVGRLCSKKC